jgi:hypothetical protein
MLLFVDLLGPSMLFIGGVEIWAPSTWKIKIKFPSIKKFYVSMAMFFIDPLQVDTNMSSNGYKENSPKIGK